LAVPVTPDKPRGIAAAARSGVFEIPARGDAFGIALAGMT